MNASARTLSTVIPDLVERIRHLPEVEVGYPADVVGEEFALIAAATVYGTSTTPPRPVLHEGWAEAAPAVALIAAERLAPALLIGASGADEDAALRAIGEVVRRSVLRVLEHGTRLAPLSPSSIRRKGGEARPLVDPAGEDRFRTRLTVRLRQRRR